MVGGAWPFLVGGLFCLVDSVNERDLLVCGCVEVIVREAITGLTGALGCSGPHACHTVCLNVDEKRWHTWLGSRNVTVRVNEEFLVKMLSGVS